MSEFVDHETTQREAATHRVTWSGAVPTFHCDGGRMAACHLFPDCDCEVWTAEHDERHKRVEHDGECWILPWLENIEPEFTWADREGTSMPPARDGEIETEWDGDQIMWSYAEESADV